LPGIQPAYSITSTSGAFQNEVHQYGKIRTDSIVLQIILLDLCGYVVYEQTIIIDKAATDRTFCRSTVVDASPYGDGFGVLRP
jgi:hypothetical protein